MKKFITIIFILLSSITLLAQFTSVKSGTWNDPLTWSTDPNATALPDSNSSVIISHTVTAQSQYNINYYPHCYDLTIDSNGVLNNYTSGYTDGNLHVHNNFINYGTFSPSYEMQLTIEGDFTNYGKFNRTASRGYLSIISYGNISNHGSFRVDAGRTSSYYYGIQFKGNNPHYIQTYNDSTIYITGINIDDSLGYVIVDSLASVSAVIKLNKSKIVLPTNTIYPNTLELVGGQIVGGEIIANGNTINGKAVNIGDIRGDANNLRIKDAVLEGLFRSGGIYNGETSRVIFEGETILNGEIQNIGSSSTLYGDYRAITIDGNFTNNGTLQDNPWTDFLYIKVENGVLNNYGNIDAYGIIFDGECSFSNIDSIAVGKFNGVDSNTTVTITSGDVIFNDRTVEVNFNGGTLNLQNNSTFITNYQWYNRLQNIIINANGADFRFASVNNNVQVNNPKISGGVYYIVNSRLNGDIEITSTGALFPYNDYYPHLYIDGNIANYGRIEDHSMSGSLYLEITGNILHDGNSWKNLETKLNGSGDQKIIIPNDSSWTGKVILDAMLTGTNYQWQKDGVDISGATSNVFTFNSGLTNSDYGIYSCTVDGNTSRTITIGSEPQSGLEITDVVITNLNATQTKVEWKTSKPATGFIFYAKEDTTSGFPYEAMESGDLVTEHSLIIDTLTTGATYYFIIDQNDENWEHNVRSSTYSFVAGEVSQAPIAHWKFDETSWNGTTNEVKDEMGNYNGTSVNGASVSTSGKFDNAGSFDGADDYINIGSELSPSNDLSVSAWIMSYGVTKSSFLGVDYYDDYIIAKGNDLAATNNSWGLQLYDKWDIQEEDSLYGCSFMRVTDQELNWTSTDEKAITPNKWYNIVGVISKDTSYLYINGELVAKEQVLGTIAPSNLQVNIGKHERPGTEYYFNGLIDEVKVYDRALSLQEIKDEYILGAEEFKITDVVITNLNETQTKVEWKTTVPTTGFIFYAKEDTTSGFPYEAMEAGDLLTEHSLVIDTLTTGATYYFIIDQNDENWAHNVRSSTYSFVAGEIRHEGNTPFDSALASLQKLASVPDEEGSAYYDGAFISNEIAYVVTSHNKLFKTTNGGENWIDVSPEQGTSFDGVGNCPKVHFINENIGAVAFSVDDGANGYDYSKVFGYVWVTQDGGQNWSEKFDVNQDQILHLEQATETTTYISGASAYGVSSNKWFKKIIYDPTNGSYTLSDITPMIDSRPHVMSGDWLDKNNGIVLAKYNSGTYNLSVFRTTDGGLTWTEINGNLPQIEQPSISFSDRGVQMIDEDTFIFSYYYPVGDGYDSKIWATEDGGVNWFETPIADSPVRLNNLSLDESADYGLICGFNSDSSKIFYVMYSDQNDWQSYLLPDVESGTGLYATELTADGTIWAIGNNQNIWKSKKTGTDVQTNNGVGIPSEYVLMQNYPNPFNPSTVIEYSLPESGNVKLNVFNSLGEEVAELINKEINAGYHSVNFEAGNLSSGIYFYRLQAGNFIQTNKMLLVK